MIGRSGVVCALGLLVCSAVQAQPGVNFDWFEYQGSDAVFASELKDKHYRNPIIAGFHPDPSFVRVGDDYYLVNSSFAYFPGLPIFHSKDLVNWQLIGHALSRRSQITFEKHQGISRGVFAPTIRFHDGLFYVISTDVDGVGNFYVTAKDPAGPWSEPHLLPAINGIDPDLFFDDDGRVYIAHNGEPDGPPQYDGHRAIWLKEVDLSTGKLVNGPGRVLVNGGIDISTQPVWIEGPHIYKINGWYYLLCAEGGTAEDHSQVVLRSRSLDEPFVAYENNPVLTQRDLDPARDNPITSVGHADLLQTPEGQWWTVFLGIRPYQQHIHNIGRETYMLPVVWEDDWPAILAPGVAVPWQVRKPSLEESTDDIPAQTGNFTWRDDFDHARLDLEWLRLRTSATEFAFAQPEDSVLRLSALPIGLEEKVQPAYLGRVQQNTDFTATTGMELPAAAGAAAGLVLFQSSDFNYFLGVKKDGDGYVVALEKTSEGVRSTVTSQTFSSSGKFIELGLSQREADLTFFFRLADAEKMVVASGIDAKLVSTQTAGGFVGATVGMHARMDEKELN